MIFGDADASKHHNVYFEGFNYIYKNEIENNMVSADENGALTEAGYGNDVDNDLTNFAWGGKAIEEVSPVITAGTPGDLSVEYLSDNKHYAQKDGKLIHVWGCFHAKLTHSSAGGYTTINLTYINVGEPWVINIREDHDSINNFAYLTIGNNSRSCLVWNTSNSRIGINSITSGTTLKFYYDGWYRWRT